MLPIISILGPVALSYLAFSRTVAVLPNIRTLQAGDRSIAVADLEVLSEREARRLHAIPIDQKMYQVSLICKLRLSKDRNPSKYIMAIM
jgi:hypothetical protein